MFGLQNITFRKFILHSFFNNIGWTILITLLGVIVGSIILVKLRKYESVEFAMTGILAIATFLFFLYRRNKDGKNMTFDKLI